MKQERVIVRPISLKNQIDTGIGNIEWGTNSLDCGRLMELLEEKIKALGVAAIMDALNKI